MTRSEIANSVNRLCQFLRSPIEEHMKAIKRVLRYLKGTIAHVILLKKSKVLGLIFFNSDWACCQDDKRNTSCYYLYLEII